MIGNGSYRSGKVQIQFSALGVRGGDGFNVFKDTGNDVVGIFFRNGVVGNYNSTNSNGGAVFFQAVNVGGNDVLAVVGRYFQQSVDVFVIQAYQVNGLGGSQRGDGGGGAPATTKAASILPSCRASALSPKLW